jgi:transposase
VPCPYPQEFRDDVVRVARSREEGVTLVQIAKDFGIHWMTLSKWIRRAAVEDGEKPAQETSMGHANVRVLAPRRFLTHRQGGPHG